jgi:hypothetical protein
MYSILIHPVRLVGVVVFATATFVSFGTFLSVSGNTQTIRVRLLDGKNGKPIGNKFVTIHWNRELMNKTTVSIDRHGVGTVEVPSGVGDFFMSEGPRAGKEPNRVAYSDCNEPSWEIVQVANVIHEGYVPKNGCGHAGVAAAAGEIVFWAHPLPWYLPDFQ